MKKLALFFDGTWNRADQHTRSERPCPTNVTKLFEATSSHDLNNNQQIVHYIQGVGTRRLERISGGGFGYGISDNIKEGYRFCVSNYVPGDQIYIFGFSRGAYSARSLAGMIRNVGILKRERLPLIHEAYDIYKSRLPKWHPDAEDSIKFRNDYTWGGEAIKFLGVFDTVGALGAPYGIVLGWIIDKLFQCRFHDTSLSSSIENAYHALAIDERRVPFIPTLMVPHKRHNASNFEEKWFPGVHSNIGGGYIKTGLSDLALKWMADKASAHGLNLDLSKVSNPPGFQPSVEDAPEQSQTLGYRIATVLLVKLPGCVGLVPKRYRAALPNIYWNGDYIRPIPNKGDVVSFLGDHPSKSLTLYSGSLNVCVLQKINQCRAQYRPPNVVGP